MKKGMRTVVWDDELQIEAYRLAGVAQPFPNHFHEYYVIGFVEAGQRLLHCQRQEYILGPGNILLFNPGDNHSCVPLAEQFLAYRGFNISQEVMQSWAAELTGSAILPVFSENVLYNKEISSYLCQLHQQVLAGNVGFGKEEALLFLLEALIKSCGQQLADSLTECRPEIEQSASAWRKSVRRPVLANRPCLGLSPRRKVSRLIVIWKRCASTRPKTCCGRGLRLCRPRWTAALPTKVTSPTISVALLV